MRYTLRFLAALARSFNRAAEDLMTHPLATLREWWDEGTGKGDFPPRRFTGSKS